MVDHGALAAVLGADSLSHGLRLAPVTLEQSTFGDELRSGDRLEDVFVVDRRHGFSDSATSMSVPVLTVPALAAAVPAFGTRFLDLAGGNVYDRGGGRIVP